MIFSRHANACVRVGSAVPPLLLLAGILFIWVRYNFGLALPLLFDRVTYNGTLYALSVSGFICMALSALLANASSFVLLLSFWRAVTLPAGPVPTWYVRRHRAAVAWFRNQFQRHSVEPTPATATTAGAPVRTASAKRVRWADVGGAGSEPAPDAMTAADSQDLKLPAPYQRSGATLLGLPASTPLAADRLSRAVNAASAEASPPAATGGASAVVGGADAHLAPSERRPWAAPPPVLRGAIGRDGGYRPGPHDMRWCRTCQSLKPPRSHHCSVCRTCVLKMDHHCPWVGNCVGYNNYKPFYLLLLWGCVALLFAYAAWLPVALGWWLPLQPSAPALAAVVAGAGSAAAPRSAEVIEGTGQWNRGRLHRLDAAAEAPRSLLRGVALAGRRVALVDRWRAEPPVSARFLSDQVAANSRFAFGGGGFAQTMAFVGGGCGSAAAVARGAKKATSRPLPIPP